MRKNLDIAIVGATGLVGKKILQILYERKIEANYHLFALENGKKVKFFNKNYIIKKLDEIQNIHLDYAFLAVEQEISTVLTPFLSKKGTIVIDNSNAFRRNKNVPLVVPQVNFDALKKHKNIIANPNCSTIQLVTVLKPIDEKFKIKRVVVSTYQAVSGAGQGGISDFINNTTKKFNYPIQNNLIPQIDVFLPNKYTKEEDKLIFESKKIMSRPNLKITATAVRVPVLNCHSESVNIQLSENASEDDLLNLLKNSKNIIIQDDQTDYPMPLFCNEKDEVFVGRLRKDYSKKNCFNLWIVSDNLRRGAASNAVDIFEALEDINENI